MSNMTFWSERQPVLCCCCYQTVHVVAVVAWLAERDGCACVRFGTCMAQSEHQRVEDVVGKRWEASSGRRVKAHVTKSSLLSGGK